MDENSNYDRFILKGLAGSAILLFFYIAVSSILGGLSFTLDNFLQLWYWMIPLTVGFGIQVGMFFYVKEEMHKKATGQAAASAGISAASMVACCTHHLAEIIPFLGLSAAGLFLIKYQSTFLLIGVLSNILGIVYMSRLVETKISRGRKDLLFYSLLAASIIIAASSFFYISANQISAQGQQSVFETLVSDQNDVEFQVTPLYPSEFQIAINTHSVQLDFDLVKVSNLYDDLGNVYAPLDWDGSAPGGHHRNGILKFPSLSKNAKSIKLVITDSTRREFDWNLK